MISLYKKFLLLHIIPKTTILISEGWRPSIYASLFKRVLKTCKLHINITFGDFLKLLDYEKKEWLRGLVKEVCDSIDVFLANSTLTYERLRRLLNIGRDRIIVSWPVIAKEKYDMLKALKPADISRKFPNTITVCHMSRLRDEDGVEHLIEIYERLRNEVGKKVRMFIVGKPLEAKFLKPYERLRVYSKRERDFKVLGYLPYKHVCKIFSKCLFFIYPAKLKPFGLPVLEAMAAGLIPVVTKTTGARDFVYLIDRKLVVSHPGDVVKVIAELSTYSLRDLLGLSKKAREIALSWNYDRAKLYCAKKLLEFLKSWCKG